MVSLGKEQPFERGESGSKSYLDHEAPASISGGSSQQAVVNEVEEFYCDSKTSEEKAYIVESTINKIKKLEIENHIDFLGFQWGVKEMTREDYDNLGEFVGW